jgi:hypothetical protein
MGDRELDTRGEYLGNTFALNRVVQSVSVPSEPSWKPTTSGHHTYADQRLSIVPHEQVVPFALCACMCHGPTSINCYARGSSSAVDPDPSRAATHHAIFGTCAYLSSPPHAFVLSAILYFLFIVSW